MKATILPNGNLEISVDSDEQAELQLAKEENEDFDSDTFMYDYFEQLTCNSEYEWAADGDIALTSAPILKITSYDDETDTETILEAYGFMDYAVTSPQECLADCGKAIFIKG